MSAQRSEIERVHIEWDEPGAGGIVVNGKRLIDFSVSGVDWSDTWDPQVNPEALAWLDRLPRLVQDRDLALETARRYADEGVVLVPHPAEVSS